MPDLSTDASTRAQHLAPGSMLGSCLLQENNKQLTLKLLVKCTVAVNRTVMATKDCMDAIDVWPRVQATGML